MVAQIELPIEVERTLSIRIYYLLQNIHIEKIRINMNRPTRICQRIDQQESAKKIDIIKKG
jgi:hypothetical protein